MSKERIMLSDETVQKVAAALDGLAASVTYPDVRVAATDAAFALRADIARAEQPAAVPEGKCPFAQGEDQCTAKRGPCSFPHEHPENCAIRCHCTPLLSAIHSWCDIYAAWGICARRAQTAEDSLAEAEQLAAPPEQPDEWPEPPAGEEDCAHRRDDNEWLIKGGSCPIARPELRRQCAELALTTEREWLEGREVLIEVEARSKSSPPAVAPEGERSHRALAAERDRRREELAAAEKRAEQAEAKLKGAFALPNYLVADRLAPEEARAAEPEGSTT